MSKDLTEIAITEALFVKLHDQIGRVVTLNEDGWATKTSDSVDSVLLFAILQELKKLNVHKPPLRDYGPEYDS